MESFRIITSISGNQQEVLVIPDDCTDKSLYHLVMGGVEYCKLLYTDNKQWEVTGDNNIGPEELQQLTKKIEEHYF